MSVLQQLWLPIVLSAVFVFIVSSIIHMALPWHKNDMQKMPDEDRILDQLRPLNLAPGDYMLPRCRDMADMKSPEFQEKMRRGPVVVATVCRQPNMGRSLALWFLFALVISYLAAYVAGHAIWSASLAGVGRHPTRFALVTAFMGYGGAIWIPFIWWGRPFVVTLKGTIDALIYAAVTAATFLWLWPHVG